MALRGMRIRGSWFGSHSILSVEVIASWFFKRLYSCRKNLREVAPEALFIDDGDRRNLLELSFFCVKESFVILEVF